MDRAPLASLDEMLSPETLSRLCGESIASVALAPFTGGHSASGSSFLAVETNDGHGPHFIVKLSSPSCDWIVRGTADTLGREMLAWTSGLLDRLPAEITHPVIACARDNDGWAILMRDVSANLLPDTMGETPISESDHLLYLDGMAALHAGFWGQSEIVNPAVGFCEPWHRYTVFSPETGQREADHPNEVVREIREGWALLWPLLEPDLTTLMQGLLSDPTSLCAALARYPQTVIHGDPRSSNLGIEPDLQRRVIMIDWQLVGPGTPVADLGWYLSNLGIKSPVEHETTIAWYRDALAQRLGPRFDERWWRPQLELSLLGQLVRLGWGHAWDAFRHPSPVIRDWTRNDLAWWCERAREGARWL
jgi:hypothetical protein